MEQVPKETGMDISDALTDYIETSYKLAVININQKTTDISAATAFCMIAGLAVFFIVMFLGIAASLWIGNLLGDNALGFLIVAFFFLLLFLALFFTRKKAFFPYVKNLIVKSIYE